MIAPGSELPTRWLSCHVRYACRHSGACCRAGWPLPVEAAVVSVIDEAVVRGQLWTVDGRANWLDDSTPGPGDVRGTFRQVDGGCVFHVPSPPLTVATASRARYCSVHAGLGHQALPASCQHFPRVCLIDARGVRVSLSHYCPTAAAMIVDDDGPVTTVDGPPAVPGRAVPEGLDAREALPPRLTDRVLTDFEGVTAWEEHVVATLGGAMTDRTAERALARVIADARRLEGWQPGSATSLAGAVAALTASGEAADPAAPARDLAEPASWLPWLAIAAATCRAPWTWPAAPSDLAGLDARYVAPQWERHAAAVRRYLAARAFGAWVAYQADACTSLARWLTLCHAVLRIEAARACAAADHRLDRELLITAIRQSDLLLVHYADSLAIAKALGDRGVP